MFRKISSNNHTIDWSLFHVVNDIILKFPADDLQFFAVL